MKAYWILIVLMAYVAFDVGKFFYYKSKAELSSIDQSGKTIGAGAKIKYIAAGDSTGVGAGASGVENTYTYKVMVDLSAGNEVNYKNIAVSGSKTSDLLDHQIDSILNFQPDIVTISIGANDLTHLKNSSSIIENFRRIKEKLTGETKAKIYITNIPSLKNAKILPLWFRMSLDRKAVNINKKIAELETEQFIIVDIYNSIPYTHETYAKDYFHPSDIGYQNWTNAFLAEINRKP